MAKKEEKVDLNQQLEQELAKFSFGDMLDLAENITDMSVECTPTGFPQLDVILHSQLKGLPHGRDIEIFSKEPEVGKTSLGLQILQQWQSLGKRTLIIDVERTITVEFLNQLGIVTNTEDPGIPAVRISRPTDALTAEQVLDLVKDASKVFDLIVVDSIGAMDIKANLEKESEENNKIGAMALLLSNFLKKNVAKRATVIWVNQTRQIVGGYNPTGNVRYATMGGRALPFFGSIRLELSIVEKLKDANDEVYALKTKVYTFKNKVSPPYKQAMLTYVLGEGFSVYYDYFDMALKLGIIQKKGGWYQYGDVKIQGDLNFYQKMKTNSDLFISIKKSIEEELTNAGAAGIPNDSE
jgi:recombination protein RecA